MCFIDCLSHTFLVKKKKDGHFRQYIVVNLDTEFPFPLEVCLAIFCLVIYRVVRLAISYFTFQ